jgi:putative nucleotidyltransferase with HDIG domain
MSGKAGTDELKHLVEDAGKSLRFPHAAFRLWQVAHDPKVGAPEVTRMIERDPAITARVLKLANSSLFQYQSEIGDIPRAVSVIGMKEVAQLALTAACVKGFSPLESELLRRADFWWHSFSCALLAQESAHSFGVAPEEAFTAGLLHDLGQMLLFARRPQVMVQVLHESLNDEKETPDLERARLGFDHADLGGAMLRQWKLPARLCDAVALHHRSAEELAQKPLANCVRLANRAAVLVEVSDTPDGEILERDLCASLGCEPDGLPVHLDENRARVDGLITALAL